MLAVGDGRPLSNGKNLLASRRHTCYILYDMGNDGPAPIIRLVRTAAKQTTLEGIREMLRVVTEELHGWGTLVWVLAPGSDLAKGHGRLFVLAYWVGDEKIRVWHELTFDSMTASVLRSGRPEAIQLGDERIAKPTPRLITESNSKYFCLAPMTLEDGSSAVLEVYRVEDRPFDEAEVGLLEQMAAVLPALYATLTDRVGFQLVRDVSEIRGEADQRKIPNNTALQRIVDRVFGVFASLEASMFLAAGDVEPGLFRLVAYRTVWEGPWTGKSEYRKGVGATGYVLEHGQRVRIVDLARYQDDRAWIEREYPGL